MGIAERAAYEPLTTETPPLGEALLTVDSIVQPERFAPGAIDLLLSSSFTISRASDRVGVRLDGVSIPRAGPDLARPIPMRRGAVQVTTSGQPVILGPDHPVTGGYPVLCVVDAASQWLLGRLPVGHPVRFRLA